MNRRKRLVCQVQSNALCCGGCWDGFRGIMTYMPDYNLLQPDIRKGTGGQGQGTDMLNAKLYLIFLVISTSIPSSQLNNAAFFLLECIMRL